MGSKVPHIYVLLFITVCQISKLQHSYTYTMTYYVVMVGNARYPICTIPNFKIPNGWE